MREVRITGWPGEATDPELEEGADTWSHSFAALMYREHCQDSMADFLHDRAYRSTYYAPIPMTFTWMRRKSPSPDQKESERRRSLVLNEVREIALREQRSLACADGNHTICDGVRLNEGFRSVDCMCECHATPYRVALRGDYQMPHRMGGQTPRRTAPSPVYAYGCAECPYKETEGEARDRGLEPCPECGACMMSLD